MPSCDADCPVRRAAQVIEGKWTTLIVRELLGGSRRYSELQRAIGGISPRLLAARLRALEAQGVLLRTVHPTVPPTTEYALTPLGRQLRPLVEAMAAFGLALQRATARRAPAPSPAPRGRVHRLR